MAAFLPPRLKYKLAAVKIQDRRLARISLWRSCCSISCALGIGIAMSLPWWEIKDRSQIEIAGTKSVSQETIYSSLNFGYPQLVWQVNGLDLTQKVRSIPSIEAVRVNRQLMPPRITIALQEKVPVAVATSQGKIGFLNASGEWIDREFYDNISDSLPKLKAIDYQRQYRQRWQQIYRSLSLYPELQIDEVQFHQSGSIYLNTKIGKVFLGADLSYLEEQFKTIARLKNLPEHLDRSEIFYIDLSNPNSALIQKY